MRPADPEDSGCAFPLGADDAPIPCGAPRRPRSSFCPEHHALCHVSPGSRSERRALAEEEALARAFGGRLGVEAREPPEALLRRLDRITRLFFCPESSRYVPRGGNMPKRIVKRPEKREPDNQEQSGDLGPTPERLQHGPVEASARAIADSLGRLSRPYRAVDTLQIMERRGSITPAMRQAGEDFRARFTVAQLDPLRALDTAHLRIAELGPSPDQAAAAPASRRPARRYGRRSRRSAASGPQPGRACGTCSVGSGICGNGLGAGLERPPRQPGSRIRHPDRRVGRARIAPHAIINLRSVHF
jgi:hypothetical protein